MPVSSYTPPSNTPPSLANPIPDTAATEDTPFSFTVTSNAFTDADGNSLTYSATQSNGSALPSWLTFNSTTRTFSGTPTNSDVATISVRVTASDGQATATDDFNITVINVNDAPTATNLSTAETYTEDTPLNFTDIVVTDVDSPNITATLKLSNPAAGSFNIATSGTVTSTYNAATGVWTASGATANVNALLAGLTFTPAANFNSNFTIATSISDGEAPAITGTKTITGVPVNDPVTGSPTATLVAGTEDTAYIITATSLLQGFADVDIATNGQILSVTGLTASNGTVANNNNGTYTFTPNANYNGTVTFTYSVTDGNGSTLSGQTRSFTLAAVNDPVTGSPTATLVAGTEDTAYTITATSLLQGFADVDIATNGQTLSVAGLTASNGTVVNNNNGTYTFTPNANYNGTVTFTYSVTDGNGSTLSGQTRSFTLAAVNDPVTGSPTATLVAGTEDTAYTITGASLLQGFADADGNNTLSVTGLTASNGTVVNNNNGTYTFTPNANYNGNVTFTYSVTDGNGSTLSGQTRSFALSAVNDAPVISVAGTSMTSTFTATNYPVTDLPQSVAVGDFNNDSRPDLVVGTSYTNQGSFSVLLNTGGSNFAAPIYFNAFGIPLDFAISDFNGDGKQDLAIAASNSDTVSVLLGNGAGGFSAPTYYTVAGRPYSIALGDFNNDGKLDLITANQINGNSLSLLLGNGAGGFANAINVSLTLNSYPRAVAVGDFNSDNKLDVVVANELTDNISVLLGNGTGGFGTPTNFAVGDNPSSVVVGDFNSDGKLDLAVANYLSSNISILLGNGTGGFDTPTNFAALYPRSIKLGDFNNDGKLDLAVANASNNSVSVLLGNGTGSFATPTNFSVGSSSSSIAVGDFNSDGKLDLATANLNNSASILLNSSQGNLNFNVNEDTNFTLTGISIADVDALSSPVQVTLSTNNGKLTFANTTGLTFTSGSNNSNTMTFTGSLTDITNALNNLVYRSNLNYSGADTITLTVNDQGNTGGGALTDTKTIAVQVNAVNQSLSTTTATDTINIGSGNDTINATFEQLQQNDQIDVGLGIDTLILQGGISSNTININLNNANQVQNIAGTKLSAFEKFDFSSFAGITQFTGGTGNDYIKAGLSNDSLVGGSGDDYLNGGAGNDTLNGGVGADTMLGSVGNDSYTVDNIGDVVTENANEGTDTVLAASSYVLSANVENLTLTGSAIAGTGNTLKNSITGNAGDNIIDGGAGNDTMVGGAGNDTYIVDSTGDVVTEAANAGTDTVAASINYTLGTTLENLTLTGTAIAGTGNTLNNSIIGNSADNIINGGTGADTMLGGAGNDLYYVEIAGDVVTENANEGTDTVSAAITYTLTDNVENLILTGTAAINGTGNSLDNSLTGNAANNTLDGKEGADTMSGGAGNDTYIVDNIGDVISENANEGTDTVSAAISYTLSANVENLTLTGTAIAGTGNTLNNSITGNAGDNIIDGGVGNDTMVGGAGNDTYIVDSTGDVVTEAANAGTDTVAASINYTLGTNLENLILTGTAIAGTGNTLNNSIIGNSADNILNGGTGNDTMSGGAGNDLYYVEIAGDVVTENANEGTDTVSAAITYTLTDNVENLILTGTALNGTGNSLANNLTGNAANNTLDGKEGADTMSGGAGNDTYIVDHIGDVVTENASEGTTDTVSASISYSLTDNVENLILTGTAIAGTGNTLNNSITGNAGDNIIDGGAGNDTMVGGAGNDTYIVDSTGDVVTEAANAGTDTVAASTNYTLAANLENLTLTGSGSTNATGNSGDNIIIGNSGNNAINGGAGADTMSGGAGNDSYTVDNAGDVVNENVFSGTDTVSASIDYILTANVENLTLTGTAITGTGNNLNNTITGNSSNNILNGGDGNDILNGGTGADTMSGGTGNDLFYVDNVGDVVSENANEGTDTVSSTINYTLTANVENLTLTGTAAINGTGNVSDNTITGNSGNNILNGGDGNDTLNGGAGNDTLNGGAGNDNLNGGAGDDSYTVDDAGDTIKENLNEGTDTVTSSISYILTANVENLILTGTAISGTGNSVDNSITGTSGNNILNGEDGNDTLNGGLGADTMSGGTGDDIYYVDNTSDAINENADAGSDTVFANINYTLTDNIENLILTGTAITGTGNSVDNIITGNIGNNILNGGAGNDTMLGGAGNDSYYVDNAGDVVSENFAEGTDIVYSSSSNYTLTANVENLTIIGTGLNGTGNNLNNLITGNSANNNLSGGGGNDILDGGLGADTLSGNAGNDIYYVDQPGDVVSENVNEGIDSVYSTIDYTLTDNVENLTLSGSAISGTGNSVNNFITGNFADNILNGEAGNDILNGGDGDDTLNGGDGADTLFGGSGDDFYYVNNVGDLVNENVSEGTDSVEASVDYTLTENVENLTLTGTTAINGIGNSADNIIIGNSGDNSLFGQDGNDTLVGGNGNDLLVGGLGADFFVFNSLSEGIDTIQDFNVTEGDSIAILLGTASLNDFSYNDTTGGLFYQGTQFATIDNKPVDFSVDSHILLI
ncbi:cadherin-like domain-containing protein [Calothrix anomala]|uniref:Cadherin-like domain-containing protein n=2 Tax=Calothrix TaxID=1186 RepID=A0ABR8A3E2_9CYAN|nr:cadherin-like domain-containing protein [Calothrix anomala]MBD2194384.1 cadherin-like domain-containing protein [Calothrix parietina FACHB-288]MBD2223166.1 cadherin-like domain-containing protein [Calothrix anomala FACHB-343]